MGIDFGQCQRTLSPTCKRNFMLNLSEPHIQNLLSIRNCIQDPSGALVRGVLEPLGALKASGRIAADMCLVLIDSLSEAEFHKPDYGDTIVSFITKHMDKVRAYLYVCEVHACLCVCVLDASVSLCERGAFVSICVRGAYVFMCVRGACMSEYKQRMCSSV